MRKQNGPRAINPLMPLDGSHGGLSLKVCSQTNLRCKVSVVELNQHIMLYFVLAVHACVAVQAFNIA